MDVEKIVCPVLNLNEGKSLPLSRAEVLVCFDDRKSLVAAPIPTKIMCPEYEDGRCKLKGRRDDNQCVYVEWKPIRKE